MHGVLDRYPVLLEDAARHRDLGWYPSGGEVQKLVYRPALDAVDRFADHVFGGIGYEAPDFAAADGVFGRLSYGQRRPEALGVARKRHRRLFEERARAEYRWLVAEYPHRVEDWISVIDETDDFGGIRVPLAVDTYRVNSTFHAVRVGRRPIVVSELMRDRPVRTLVEIGGGHGRTMRDLVRLLGVETAFYVDLPLNMLLAARFLGQFFPGRVHLVWAAGDVPVAGDINIVAPWLVDRIEVPVDLLVNFLSFQHMSIDALRFYGERLIEPWVAALYHQNRDRPRESFDYGLDDYPFRTPFTVVDRRKVHTSEDGKGNVFAAIVGELLAR